MDISTQFHELLTTEGFIQLLVLSLLEVVLGIDNLIFISLTAAKILDKRERNKARMIGLLLALFIRAGMLFSISWLTSAQTALFYIGSLGISIGNLVMLAGGAFLLWKTIVEIHEKIYHEDDQEVKEGESIRLGSAIFQIIVIDFVFSFDSILAAIKIAQKSAVGSVVPPCPGETIEKVQAAVTHSSESNVVIMVGGVLISMIIMLVFSEGVSKFITQYPTIKMLALAFLLVIGVSLVLDCFHVEIPKPCLYAALGFSILVETLNIVEKKVKGAKYNLLHKSIKEKKDKDDKGHEL
jgi:predicted tellurium resistance membrane protein TerC